MHACLKQATLDTINRVLAFIGSNGLNFEAVELVAIGVAPLMCLFPAEVTIQLIFRVLIPESSLLF